MIFKIGDVVRCIAKPYLSPRGLEIGKLYTIIGADNLNHCVTIKEIPDTTFWSDLFVKETE